MASDSCAQPEYNYLPGPDDIYCFAFADTQVRLRTGDTISGQIRPPKEGERYFRADQGRGDQFRVALSKAREKVFFDNLTPLYPAEMLRWKSTRQSFRPAVIDLGDDDRQGPARSGRFAATHRQNHAAADDRQLDRHQSSRSYFDRPVD
jgi:transcription termination factor Rho